MLEKITKIKLFATDFDGVHTDGKVTVDENGIESVRCSRKDGLGYDMLAKAGIHTCVISKEGNHVVSQRCKKLKIPCYQGVSAGEEKLEILKRVTADLGLTSDQVLYMGDDLNDLEPLKYAGVAVTVKNGHHELHKIADYITTRDGGDHAIREVCELLLSAKGLPFRF